MIDVQLHFRGVGTEQRSLPAVPAIGSCIGSVDGRLWRVADVVIDGEAAVNVYCVEVSDCLAGELTAAWATWEKLSEEEATACEPYTATDSEPDRARPNRRGSMQGPGESSATSTQSGRSNRREPSPAKSHFPAVAAAEAGESAATLGKAGCTGEVANCTCPSCAKERIKRRGGGLTFPLDNR